MKYRSHSNLILRSSLAFTLAFLIWAPVWAQTAASAEGATMTGGKIRDPHQGMTEAHQAMMQHHQAMMADMKAEDAGLAAQVAMMNSAPAEKKLELMAAIVTRLVEQRTAMDARMESMHGEMMKRTMSAMPMDATAPSQPPMMKGMGMDGKTEDAKK